jgi:hypothetical protein
VIDFDDKGLLVVGMVRSGTTLISRTIDAHPDAACPPDPFFGFFRLLRNALRARFDSEFDRAAPLSDYFLSDRPELDALLEADLDVELLSPIDESVAEIKRFAEHNAPLLFNRLDEIRTINCKDLFHALLGFVAEQYGGSDCQHVGFKQTWVEALVPAVLRSFPNTRVVHVIRDPRSVIASWREAADLTHQYPFLMMIRHWRKSVAFASLGTRRNSNYSVVRYEDFVGNTAEANRLWEVCGLPPIDIASLSFRDGKGQPWVSNSSYSASMGITSSHIQAWRDRLSDEEATFVEHLCAPEMAWAGYERCWPDTGLTPFLNPPSLYRTKGETDWISQYAETYALNGGNMAREAGRLLIARELVESGKDEMSECARALFLDSGILSK